MHVMILADIEGSSGCFSRAAAAFMTRAWRKACWEMTADVKAVVLSLKQAGVPRITVYDFHRTGFNLMAKRLPEGCRLVFGYRAGPVPGVGDPGDADLVMMIGMHAPSGSDGFLAHTLTSRVASLQVNGQLLAEAQLFAASLAPYGIRPLFFSGCPVACRQAEQRIRGLQTFPIYKNTDGDAGFDRQRWRREMAAAAARSLTHLAPEPYQPAGPFSVRLALRDGPAVAAKLSRRWRLGRKGNALYFESQTFEELYDRLLTICYLTPVTARHRRSALWLYSLWGRLGQWWVRTLPNPPGNI